MAKIQELLKGKDDQIDFLTLIKQQNWIVQKNYNCILSPDSDGFLCGLFMSHYFNWKIKGFYDGKVLLLNKDISVFDKNCAFLDIEIFRKTVKSIGHHMLKYNKRLTNIDFSGFDNTIQPNLLRNYDGKNEFRLKYPLATIHFLIAIAASQKVKIDLPDSALAPLFFVDGTFQVLYTYPENVLNWLNFLRINEKDNPLRKIFMNEKQTVHSQMLIMDDFFRKRDEISIPNERGDRLRISTKSGEFHNILKKGKHFNIDDNAKSRVVKFIQLLSDTTGWEFKKESWCFDEMNISKFSKKDFTSQKLNLTNKTYEQMMNENPLSWAMTSGNNIEYTVEKPDQLK